MKKERQCNGQKDTKSVTRSRQEGETIQWPKRYQKCNQKPSRRRDNTNTMAKKDKYYQKDKKNVFLRKECRVNVQYMFLLIVYNICVFADVYLLKC